MKHPPKDVKPVKPTVTKEAEGFNFNEDADIIDDEEAMVIQLLELMNTLTKKRQLEPILRYGLFPIVNCMAYYSLFNKE